MKPAIEIRNLGKKYSTYQSNVYTTFREAIAHGAARLFSRPRNAIPDFWALKDINLDIEQGERIGIIGKNGAGKSTLLKILSRITVPTCGRAVVTGRLSSLLEVGTGFHPELTGRENVYMNGSILGLKKSEIDRQFQTILDFSGVGTFIDTPLKYYSSGMQLRLAFSVAAHLEPEIFLIDEVLAVGDWEFQQRCLGKMEEINKSKGRTILFVSHNFDAIRKFCSTVILLDHGQIVEKGSPENMITKYISAYVQSKSMHVWEPGKTAYNGTVVLEKVYLHDTSGVLSSKFETTEKVGVTMEYTVLREGVRFTHSLNLFNQENIHIFSSHDVTSTFNDKARTIGKYKATAWLPDNLLPEGFFSLSIALFIPSPLDIYVAEDHVLTFETFTNFTKLSARGNYTDEFPGIVRPLIQWEAEIAESKLY